MISLYYMEHTKIVLIPVWEKYGGNFIVCQVVVSVCSNSILLTNVEF